MAKKGKKQDDGVDRPASTGPDGFSEMPATFDAAQARATNARFAQTVQLVRSFALIEDQLDRQRVLALADKLALGQDG